MANRIAVAGPFCENCPYIEAKVTVERNDKNEVTGWTFGCQNQLKCGRIADFLKDYLQGKKHEDSFEKMKKEMDHLSEMLGKGIF